MIISNRTKCIYSKFHNPNKSLINIDTLSFLLLPSLMPHYVMHTKSNNPVNISLHQYNEL